MTVAAPQTVTPTAQRVPQEHGSDGGPHAAPVTAAPPRAPHPHQWTVGEFMRMIELGLVRGRVDLVGGEVIDMPAAMGDRHAISRERVTRWLHREFPEPYFIRSQETHRFADDLAREPDAAVLTREPRPEDTLHELPSLVIEVADDSLHYDLSVKRLEYARVGVPEYWVIDIPHRRVRVFREPDTSALDPERAYKMDLVAEGDTPISPLCRSGATTTANSLLPPTGF